MGEEDFRTDFAALAAEAAELLRWEASLGAAGVPPWRAPAGGDRVAPPRETADAEPQTAVHAAPASAIPASPVAPGARLAVLGPIAAEAAECTRCELHAGRTHSVFARGNPDAELVFVGEGPGYHEDQEGLPFVGPAGQLLDRMIVAMGYGRDEVYICNVVKCRPPNNRTPLPTEARACEPFLRRQLEIVAPKMIVALGRCAAENLGLVEPGGRGWRGVVGDYRGIPVMPTYHPAFLLRTPEQKRTVWEDLQVVMKRLGKKKEEK